MQKDRHEQTNLAGHPDLKKIQQGLLTELKAWMKRQGDELTVLHEPLMLNAPETWKARK